MSQVPFCSSYRYLHTVLVVTVYKYELCTLNFSILFYPSSIPHADRTMSELFEVGHNGYIHDDQDGDFIGITTVVHDESTAPVDCRMYCQGGCRLFPACYPFVENTLKNKPPTPSRNRRIRRATQVAGRPRGCLSQMLFKTRALRLCHTPRMVNSACDSTTKPKICLSRNIAMMARSGSQVYS